MANPNTIVPISPEELEIANTYLLTRSVEQTARELGIHPEQVNQYLDLPEVKSYIDRIYFESGYRNRFKFAEIVDSIVEKKLEELQEADIGSTKDIMDILALVHKMKMDEMNIATKLAAGPKTQTNIQINNPFVGTNYGELMGKLLDVENK